MNKIAQGLIGATAAILLLAGCSAVSAQAQDAPSSSSTTTSASTATKTESPSPSASHNPDWGKYTQDEFYIKSVEFGWVHDRPDNKTLISYAHAACAALRSGTPRADVTVVNGSGDIATAGNKTVVTYAIQVYCPEFTS